jgi:histidyl-tRNA synthetase
MVLLGENARRKGFLIAQKLREAGLSVELDYESKSAKSQMRLADKLGAFVAVIIGDDELKQSIAQIRFMKEGSQRICELDDLVPELLAVVKRTK